MSITHIPGPVRRKIVERAGNRCEYCLLPAEVGFFPHEIDHVIAEKHGGKTETDNLAYACWRCNRHKGTDLGSFDPETNGFSPLFNPRTQVWTDHFEFHGEHSWIDSGRPHDRELTPVEQQQPGRRAHNFTSYHLDSSKPRLPIAGERASNSSFKPRPSL